MGEVLMRTFWKWMWLEDAHRRGPELVGAATFAAGVLLAACFSRVVALAMVLIYLFFVLLIGAAGIFLMMLGEAVDEDEFLWTRVIAKTLGGALSVPADWIGDEVLKTQVARTWILQRDLETPWLQRIGLVLVGALFWPVVERARDWLTGEPMEGIKKRPRSGKL